jgi:Rrf2 family protein
MNNGRFAINIHILTILAQSGDELVSSDYIASSLSINPVLVRKEISVLRKAGIVISKEGKNGGSKLAKSSQEIYLSEIFKIVSDGRVFSHSKNEPNNNCPIGKQITEHLQELFGEVEKSVLQKPGCTTLQQFVGKFI